MTERNYDDYFRLARNMRYARDYLLRSLSAAALMFGKRSLHYRRLQAQVDALDRLQTSLHRQYCADVPFADIPDVAPRFPFTEPA